MSASEHRVVVVANRLPVTVRAKAGGFRVEPSPGGLAAALRPLMKNSHGVWIGWTGTEESPAVQQLLEGYSSHGTLILRPIFMTQEERSRFYCGFSNEVLWPLFHDLQSRCNFDPSYWDAHLTVNRKFALQAADEAGAGDLVWVHDYHLMSVAACLRRLKVNARLTYFHHIPFPGPDIFEKLPWREEILAALLDFNLLGFQTLRDRGNFVSCLRRFAKGATIVERSERLVVTGRGQSTTVGTFPIGIDFDEFARDAAAEEVGTRAGGIVHDLNNCRIILGVDRLDYTKGIPERLAAFRHLLECHPELHQRITLVQVVVPSREDIPRYAELKSQIQRMVSEINGQYGELGWVPVHYIHRSLNRRELLAYYRAADIALITPLKDGMNLVAKEYCAARVNHDGVLILSEFAGAAFQLRTGALLVNPYDTRAVAQAIFRAYAMSGEEAGVRMRTLRAGIQQDNVFRWRDSFWACARSLDATPGQDRLALRQTSATACSLP